MSNQEEKLQKLVDSLGMQCQLLAASASMECTEPSNPRDMLVRDQMRRAAELVRGAATLGASRNAACLGILSRSLLEQLIKLLWAIKSEDNANESLGAAKAELSRALRANLVAGKAKITNRESGEDASEAFLNSEGMQKIAKQKSVEQQAKEAGIHDLYTVFYRFMSLDTHGHQIGRERAEGDKDLCEIQLHSVGGISRAIGQAGVWWLLHRSSPDNESLREVLGLNKRQ
ncbi:MAG: DUF5677 domain-containing protein [Pseudomonadota bacterium]|nr:DUF5677 domain-containing protein [Pseudomonadota bacterium]